MSGWNAVALERLRSVPGFARVLGALASLDAVFVVGGAVRDVLLGRSPGELDFAVEGDAVAAAELAASALEGEVGARHERFGTATVWWPGGAFDIASTRRERYAHPGALPDVQLGAASIEEDLGRRDFSVNALAVRVGDGAGVAWAGALEDLEARRLRVLHERSFVDDPTRLVRLARYAGRLGFGVDPGTRALVDPDVLGTVSGERLGAEVRLLAAEPQPAGFVALEEIGLGKGVLHPAFALDPGLIERALDVLPPDGRRDLLALAAVLLAVPAGELSVRLDELAFPARDRAAVLAAAGRSEDLAAALAGASTPSAVWELLHREGAETVALAGALAGPEGRERARRWLDELRHFRLAIDGDDLVAAGLSGPAVGAALEAALRAALDGQAPGREEQLAAALGPS